MQPISIERAIEIAKAKGLKPGLVKGTEGVQFTNGRNERLEVIDWDTFRDLLARRRLQVYESGGWMKIQKPPSKGTRYVAARRQSLFTSPPVRGPLRG